MFYFHIVVVMIIIMLILLGTNITQLLFSDSPRFVRKTLRIFSGRQGISSRLLLFYFFYCYCCYCCSVIVYYSEFANSAERAIILFVIITDETAHNNRFFISLTHSSINSALHKLLRNNFTVIIATLNKI